LLLRPRGSEWFLVRIGGNLFVGIGGKVFERWGKLLKDWGKGIENLFKLVRNHHEPSRFFSHSAGLRC